MCLTLIFILEAQAIKREFYCGKLEVQKERFSKYCLKQQMYENMKIILDITGRTK